MSTKKYTNVASTNELGDALYQKIREAELEFYKRVALNLTSNLEDLRSTVADGGLIVLTVGRQQVKLQQAPE